MMHLGRRGFWLHDAFGMRRILAKVYLVGWLVVLGCCSVKISMAVRFDIKVVTVTYMHRCIPGDTGVRGALYIPPQWLVQLT